jgi:hypothetical protein
MKKQEPESIGQIRHRYSRTIEMWVAYQTFLNRQVEVGPDKVCLNKFIVVQTTHTLLVAYYSFLYSLFDQSGSHFEKATEELLPHFPTRAIEVRNLILDHWKLICGPVTRIRHNIGFHHAKSRKGVEVGYDAYKELHPLSSEYIMNLFRVFFRALAEVYEYSEPYSIPPKKEDTEEIYQMAMHLKRFMDENPTATVVDASQSFLRNLR